MRSQCGTSHKGTPACTPAQRLLWREQAAPHGHCWLRQGLVAALVPVTCDQDRHEREHCSPVGRPCGGAVGADDISTGASNDLQCATDTARAMVTRYGFSERMGPVVYGTDPGETLAETLARAGYS